MTFVLKGESDHANSHGIRRWFNYCKTSNTR